MVSTISRPLTEPSLERHLFSIFLFLSLFHLPLIEYEGDSVGVFDVYLVAYVGYILLNPLSSYRIRKPAWSEFFLLFGLYVTYFALRLPWYVTPGSVLLAIKTLEYGFIFFACIAHLETYGADSAALRKVLIALFIVLALFQGASFLSILVPVAGFGEWSRVGLPFTTGTSSNPAGFVLGIALLLLLFMLEQRWSLMLLVAMALLAVAFFLTLSRTNLLGFVVVAALYALARVMKKASRVMLVAAAGLLLYGAVVYLMRVVPSGHPLYYVLKLVQSPAAAFTDRSFLARLSSHWPEAFGNWLHGLDTLLFGKGLAFLPIVDGTVPRLLGNKGAVGLLLYLAVWFGFFAVHFRRHRRVLFVLLFALINSITAETLVVSYRSVQAYVPLLLIILYRFDPTEMEDQ